MLKLGIVEPSHSEWSSPVIIIPKSDGGWRWTVDLRKVNALAKSDGYPLPSVDEMVNQLRDAKYLSSVDLNSAYFQIPLEESSKEKTAFIVPGKGLFQFARMPQGLNSSAAVLQRFIDNVIGFDLQLKCFAYLDDIVIASSTFEEHLEVLVKVLSRLEAANLTINLTKCKICMPQLRYLGYVVDRNGLRVNPDKAKAIVDFSEPSLVTETKRFIGLTSWYRRFVRNFSTIMAPITALTKGTKKKKAKNSSFQWTSECRAAFQEIKKRLTSAPFLVCPGFSKQFYLHTDASNVGLGAILSMEPDGSKVVTYASRSLSEDERKYTTKELECLAVLWAVEKLREYLEGQEFTVITDHASLLWLDSLKKPQGRLGRWAVRLQQFKYKLMHRKGGENDGPDVLSRAPVEVPSEHVDLVEVKTSTDLRYTVLFEKVQKFPEDYPEFRIEGNQLFKLVCVHGDNTWVRLIPIELREKVFKEVHDDPTSGHFGIRQSFYRLERTYLWPSMKKDLRDYMKKCKVCLAYKPMQEKAKGLMSGSLQVSAPFHRPI